MIVRSRLWPAMVLLVLSGAFAIACNADTTPRNTTTPAATNSGTDSASTALPRSARELRIASNVFPTAQDPDVGFASFAWMSMGVAEALFRVTPDSEIVPWLAEELVQVDEHTWRVTLRDDVTFSDGSKMDAAAVQASFERTLELNGGPVAFAFPAGTTFAADGQMLDITTPTPSGAMASNLATFYLVVKKVAPTGEILFTGPYTPTDFVEGQSMVLRSYDEYRVGPPRTPTIKVLSIPDVNARVLALQAGDVDLALAVLPSQQQQLENAGFTVESFLFGRIDAMILNNTRPPLDDVAVRRAIALTVDRDALVQDVLHGQGQVAYGLASRDWGIASAIDTQRFDVEEAQRQLDAAGWIVGADGIRVKDGQRLQFAIGSYASRPELSPFAVVVQSQLRAIGIETSLEEYSNINQTVADSTFDATMYSYTVTPNGDLSRGLAQLYVPGGSNQNRYDNPQVNALFDQYNAAADLAERDRLAREMQTLIGEDVPVVYLVFPNQLVAMSSKVSGYTPHPLENYQIDANLYIAD